MTNTQRYFLNATTLATLTGLALVIFLRLLSLHKDLERSSHDILYHISESHLSKEMDEMVNSLVNRLNQIHSNSDELKSISSLRTVPAVPTFNFPLAKQSRVRPDVEPVSLDSVSIPEGEQCKESLRHYGSALVSFSCVTFAVQPFPAEEADLTDDHEDILKAATYFRATNAAASLYDLYPEWQRKQAINMPEPFIRKLPSILFVHMTFFTDSAEVGAVYPGTYADKGFDFRQRPWYEPTESVGDFAASRLYHDYNTQSLVISVIKTAETNFGTVRVGADYKVQYSGAGLDS